MRASLPDKRVGHPLSMEIIKYNRNTNNKTKGTQADRRKKKKSLTELNADKKAKM
jgi:hypothetical protein